MTETYQKGKCASWTIRVKTWKAGFSLRCVGGYKTALFRPFDETMLKEELSVFCEGCGRE